MYGKLHDSHVALRFSWLLLLASPLLDAAHGHEAPFVLVHLGPVAYLIVLRQLLVAETLILRHGLPQGGALLGEGGEVHLLRLTAIHSASVLHEEGIG